MYARGAGARVIDSLAEVGQAVGAATWFGGQLFATVGLHPGVEVLSDRGERTRVIDEAWRRYRPYGSAGLWLAKAATFALSWRALQEPSAAPRGLAWLNVACAAGAVAASSAAAYFGKEVARATPDRRTPVATATQPADETPPRAREAQRWLTVSEGLSLAFGMGWLVASSLMTAARSARDGAGEVSGDEIRGGASTWRAAESGPSAARRWEPRVTGRPGPRRPAEFPAGRHFGGSRGEDVPLTDTPGVAVSPAAGRDPMLPEIAS
jgi:hypothetical protein